MVKLNYYYRKSVPLYSALYIFVRETVIFDGFYLISSLYCVKIRINCFYSKLSSTYIGIESLTIIMMRVINLSFQ
jgi:hypothetical protein